MNLATAKDWYSLSPDAFLRAVKILSFREREVLNRRIGIGYDGPSTLARTADSFRVSTCRIRQIESKACRRMFHLLRGTVN